LSGLVNVENSPGFERESASMMGVWLAVGVRR
jgi:hypothetical protein